MPDTAAQRVDVLVDGELFTSYVYSDTLPVLKKPVLYPLRTASGATVTRGYPLDARPGERVDHPHHIGLWFNYGDVEGLDFWNNSDVVPAERAAREPGPRNTPTASEPYPADAPVKPGHDEGGATRSPLVGQRGTAAGGPSTYLCTHERGGRERA